MAKVKLEDLEVGETRPGAYGQKLSSPMPFFTTMVIFLIIVCFIAAILYRQAHAAFITNPGLNGLILGVLVVGIILVFAQVLALRPEVRWFNSFRAAGDNAMLVGRDPKLLAPMRALIGGRRSMAISTAALRSILDSIGTRLDESRDTTRYLIGLLVFLGLLGTFWGLLGTIGSINEVIGSLDPASGDSNDILQSLKTGLTAPLSGMGTAFSSSLFGLGGSLILGFLDLNAGQAQNQFYNELEEWLSGFTRFSSGGAMSEGEAPMPVYVTALLEQTADTVERLQAIVARGEESRVASNQALLGLSSQLASLTDHLQTDHEVSRRMLDGQREVRSLLEQLVQQRGLNEAGMDLASRQHLRNIDVHLSRMMQDASDGRERTLSELRSDLKLLTRTVAALAQEQRKADG